MGIRRIFDRWASWLPWYRRRAREAELARELRDHLELEAEEQRAAGLSSDEAGHAAHRALGNTVKIEEDVRDVWRWRRLDDFLLDIRYALRMLRKAPGFAAIAVVTLALGIGANTAMFSVVEGVVLSPLPYRRPDRLVMVLESNARFPIDSISYPNFQDWQRSARSFDAMAAYMYAGYNLTGPGAPEHVEGKPISAGFFRTLGVPMALGRDFTSQEDRPNGAPVVIISNRLWRERFGGSLQALSQSVVLDGTDRTVVGVLPAGFRFGHERADVYTPFSQLDPVIVNNRPAHYAASIARLKTGVSIAQAQAELSEIQERLDKLHPDANRGTGTVLVTLKSQLVGNVSGTLYLLLGAVGMVLVIACANEANLLMARSAARRREFAIRSALGASRARVVRQLLAESALLSLAGGIVGLAIAKWGISAMLAAVPGSLPRSENVGVNGPVLLFTLGVSIAVGILFGLGPALRGTKTDSQGSLKEGGRGATTRHHRAQGSLVVVQMALTLVLLAGAELLFRTIRNMWQTNPGFDVEHLITFKVGLSPALMKTPESTRNAYEQMMKRIRGIPGVVAADLTDLIPLGGQDDDMPFWFDVNKPASLQNAPRVLMFVTGPDYLRTMGIPLLRGRFFTPEDTNKSPCVMVVDSVFASMYLREKNPIGQMMSTGTGEVGPCRIVGVVGHVRHWSLGRPGTYTRDQAYFPLYQDPDKWVQVNFPYSTVIVRTSLDAASLIPSIKEAIYGGGRGQTVYNVQTMEKIASESMASERFPMILLEVFAGLALILAAIGIYGVISYSVTQRVHEIGIRMALGAQKRDVLRMVIGQGLRLALAGVGVGIVLAIVLVRVLSSFSRLLYGVSPEDPALLAAAAGFLVVVVMLACYVPSRRAMRVDPTVALRHE